MRRIKPVWALLIIFLAVFAVITGVYVANFHEAVLSKDPGDWGALGDYFGGLLNPALSAMTLLFVALTYMSQKEELRRVQESAGLMDELRRKETEAQITLSASHQVQTEISNRISQVTLLNAMLSARYRGTEFLQNEINRASANMSAGTTSFYSVDNKRYIHHQDKAEYIIKLTQKIAKEKSLVSDYLVQIEAVSRAHKEAAHH